MNYENNIHLPQQMELLLHHRAEGNIEAFDYILNGIKIIMKEHDTFLIGLVGDKNKREKQVINTAKQCKETILKGFVDGLDLDGCQHAQNVLSGLETAYNNIMLEYMNDVIQTCMSYQERKDGESI